MASSSKVFKFPAPGPSDKSAAIFDLNAYTTVAEDNMNVQLKDITVTARDGRVSHLDQVYIRGSHVRFFIVPDMLRYNIFSGAIAMTSCRGVLRKKLTNMQECAHVQIERDEGKRCWISERKGDRQ